MTPLIAVLDTNALVDWLVFRGAHAAPMIHALEAGHLHAITNAECRAEFERVLAYPALKLSPERQADILNAYGRNVEAVEAPLVADIPRCRDRDDQKFINLAVGAHADLLISRDARVLALHASLRRRFNVCVLEPHGVAGQLALRNPVEGRESS